MRVKAFHFHRGITVECLQFGTEKFGWSRRNAEVGAMKRDGVTLGWGVGGAAWIATRDSAAANVELRDDGSARVACGAQDIGTGTYTVLALLTADKTACRSRKWKWCLATLSFRRTGLGRFVGHRIGGAAVFAAADNAISSYCRSPQRRPDRPFEKRKPDDLAFQTDESLSKLMDLAEAFHSRTY